MKKNSGFTIALPLIIGASIILGMYIAHITGYGTMEQTTPLQGYNKLDLILDFIEQEYVDSLSADQLVEQSIPKVLEQLDPHSAYIPAEDFNEVNDPLEGEFEGIGVQFNVQKDTVVVIQVIAGGPSERVNLKAGDRIVTVDDSLIAGIGINSRQVVKLLKGPKGTKVKVGISRRGEQELKDFIITRDKIPFYSIDVSYMVDETLGYLKISRFAMTTYDEFKEHVAKLRSEGMNKLILDLRNNGGGVLNAAIMIANEFLEEGKLIVYTEGRAHPRNDYVSDSRSICKDVKLVILINENSASASEVLAGAIQDNDRGLIVGRRSFGKGLVMTQKSFSDNSAVRLTIQRYHTPTGRCIQKPYEDNLEDYYSEIYSRELFHDDTTTFPDSLKYTTPGGKTVYGGGGIMPDYFVPFDTTELTPEFSELVGKGLIYEYAFEYADRNRTALTVYEDYKALMKYLDKKQVLTDFYNYAIRKDKNLTRKSLQTSEHLLKNRLYSYIVRNVFDDEGYYPVSLALDTTFLEAVELLK